MDTTGNHLNVRRTANERASFRKATMFSKSWMWSTQTSTLISLLSARFLLCFVLLVTWYSDGELRCTEVACSCYSHG